MLSQDVVANYYEKYGVKHTSRVLSVLGRQQKFIDALSTEIGQQLMNDVLVEMEPLLDKIVEETATPKDLADYRALKNIANRWAAKIAEYNKQLEKITKTAR